MNSPIAWRPTDLPELRGELARFPSSPLCRRILGGLPRNESSKFNRLVTAASVAELFYIASPMVDLAMAAKDSLEDFQVQHEDLPADIGFCYFAKPISVEPVVGIALTGGIWRLSGAELEIGWLFDTGYLRDAEERSGKNVSMFDTPRLMMLHGFNWSTDDSHGLAMDPLWGRLFMKAAWLLMQQSVASVNDATYDRATRKRLQRKDIAQERIRVITLRRPTSAGTAGDSDREYHHQWIVRGHWRQQFYPSRKVHRPIWIAPHIKGPEGAPLLGGEKVYAWTR